MPRKPSPDLLSLHIIDNARRAVHALQEQTRPDRASEGRLHAPAAGPLAGWDGCYALHVRCGYVMASIDALSEEIERAMDPALRDEDDEDAPPAEDP